MPCSLINLCFGKRAFCLDSHNRQFSHFSSSRPQPRSGQRWLVHLPRSLSDILCLLGKERSNFSGSSRSAGCQRRRQELGAALGAAASVREAFEWKGSCCSCWCGHGRRWQGRRIGTNCQDTSGVAICEDPFFGSFGSNTFGATIVVNVFSFLTYPVRAALRGGGLRRVKVLEKMTVASPEPALNGASVWSGTA